MRLLGLLLAGTQGLAADPRHVRTDDDEPRFDLFRPVMPPEPSTLIVVCPRCKAEVGKPCDPRSLGRHREHRARVEAARELRRGGGR